MVQMDNVYLIDDDEIVNFMNAQTLAKATFAQNVKTFDNAVSALEEIKQLAITDPEKLPDMIFLDISMPVMNSWNFLDHLSALSDSVLRNCKIYILTASFNPEDIDHAKDYKMVTDFISKPLTVERLQAISVEPHSTSKTN